MVREIPQKHQALYNQAVSGKSRKAAVRSFCLECVGYQVAEISRCSDGGCPLYAFRLRG